MWLDHGSRTAIDEFWKRAGRIEPFPRNLERAIAFALPLTIVKTPRLRLWSVESYLKERGIPFQFDTEPRGIRGCLLAYVGNGVIFLDGSDSADEQRITLAHELGHFISDYQIPRQTAVGKIGPSIIEALDGHRDLTLEERIYATLSGMSVGAHIKLIERDTAGLPVDQMIWKIEERADKVALELLAPRDEVLNRVDLALPRFEMRRVEVMRVLRETFGLPRSFAHLYASNLLEDAGKGRSWLENFRSL